MTQRYVAKVRAEDPEGFLAMAARLTRLTRPFLSRRGYATSLFILGVQNYRTHRYPAALAAFDQALRLGPRPTVLAPALAHQAACRWQLGDNEGAVRAAAEAIPLLEPLLHRKPAWYGRALLHARWALALGHYGLGQWAEAVPALERFLRMARAAPGDLTPFLREAAKALATAQERLADAR